MIDRIDEQPTPLAEPYLRIRNVFNNRRSGRDRRKGWTMMDPKYDRRKAERRERRSGGVGRRIEFFRN